MTRLSTAADMPGRAHAPDDTSRRVWAPAARPFCDRLISAATASMGASPS